LPDRACTRVRHSFSCSLCLILNFFSGMSWGEPLSPSPSSDVWSWYSRGRSPTPSPPLSEGGSSSSFWTQNTTDEGIVIDDFSFDDLPKKKRVSFLSASFYWRYGLVSFLGYVVLGWVWFLTSYSFRFLSSYCFFADNVTFSHIGRREGTNYLATFEML